MNKGKNFLQPVMKIFVAMILMMGSFSEFLTAKNVTGEQTGRWVQSESPYVVDGDIIIPAGQILTIEPGVIVKFTGYYRFKVNGTLMARGNASNKIIFTSSKDFEFGTSETSETTRLSPQTNDWDLIEFNDDRGQNASELSHCILRYSAGVILCNNASPILSNILITDCQSHQVYVNGTMQPIKQGQEISLSALRSKTIPKFNTEDEINPFAGTDEFTFGEMMVISAARREQRIEESPSTISVITSEEIENSGSQTLFELLQRVPGMNSRHLGMYDYLDIRSSTVDGRNARVLILVNGVPWHSPGTGAVEEVSKAFPLINVDRIEIIRGPGSSLYGTHALNGVINIITRKAGSFSGIFAEVNSGSFNQMELKLTGGKQIKDLGFLLNFRGISTKGAQNYTNNPTGNYVNVHQPGLELGNGSLITSGNPNDNMDLRGFHVSGEAKYKNLTLFTGFDKDDHGDYGSDVYQVFNFAVKNPDPGPPLAVSIINTGARDHSRIKNQTIFGDLKYIVPISATSNLQLRTFYFQLNQTITLLNQIYAPSWVAFPPTGMPDKIVYAEDNVEYLFDASLRLAEAQLNLQPFENDKLVTGLEFRTNTTKSNSYIDKDKTYSHNLFAFYIENELKAADKFVFVLGGRYDKNFEYDGVFSPRVSFLTKLNSHLTTRASHGWAFRAPEFSNLYAEVDLGLFMIKSNEQLKPERIKTTELAVDYRSSRFALSVIGFHSMQRDLIAHRSGDSYTGMMPDFIQLNIGSVDAIGAEIDLKGNISNSLTSYLNYTYQNIVYGDLNDDKGFSLKDEPVEYVPSHKINLGFTWKPGSRLTVNTNGYYMSKMNYFTHVDTDGIPAPPYSYIRTVNEIKSFLNLNSMLKVNVYTDLDVFISGINLLGTTYEQHPGYPMPGRQIYLGVRYQNIIK
ncbi:TonB-dependent receptor [candidate division KSB1 bacterium]|nr:TonB-dependent receptor [candidate division KSB1 bacterium]